jgi:hypothetical protein
LCPNARSGGRALIGPWMVAMASGEVRRGASPLRESRHGRPLARFALALRAGLAILEPDDEAQFIAGVGPSDDGWTVALFPRRLSVGGDLSVRLSEPGLTQVGPVEVGQ